MPNADGSKRALVVVIIMIRHRIHGKMKSAMSWLFILVVSFSPAIAARSLRGPTSYSVMIVESIQSKTIACKRSQNGQATLSAIPLLNIRGGGKSNESDLVLFTKVGINAVLETAAMLGILAATKKVAAVVAMPKLSGLPLIQWFGTFIIAYASSFIGSIIEGGISAATNQVLDPKAVPGSPEWYSRLKKPRWNPPGWLFPIMWLIISKPTQMIAVSKVLTSRPENLPLSVLAPYCSHLALGNAWNKVFFGMQDIGRGVAVITAFYGLLLASAYTFYQVEPSAGIFLLPTCGWVTVATALNWSIYLKNK